MTETVARALDATRRYGEVVALDHVSIDIGSGELGVWILGAGGFALWAYRRDEGRRFA